MTFLSELTQKPTLEPCCDWCRQPVRLCRDVSCDDADVYLGVPSPSGTWEPLEEEPYAEAA